jgi:hypothetical protein
MMPYQTFPAYYSMHWAQASIWHRKNRQILTASHPFGKPLMKRVFSLILHQII